MYCLDVSDFLFHCWKICTYYKFSKSVKDILKKAKYNLFFKSQRAKPTPIIKIITSISETIFENWCFPDLSPASSRVVMKML